jgi:hypothetical protein
MNQSEEKHISEEESIIEDDHISEDGEDHFLITVQTSKSIKEETAIIILDKPDYELVGKYAEYIIWRGPKAGAMMQRRSNHPAFQNNMRSELPISRIIMGVVGAGTNTKVFHLSEMKQDNRRMNLQVET